MLDKSIDVAFAFGPFRLIPGQHVLLRDNRPVKLGGRALDILHLLVMRAGQEVSKNALIESAWPNVFVDEHNLKVHISSLRRALEDTLPQATYIATVVGRGYQFVGRVQTESIEVEGFSVDEQPIVSSLPAPSTLVGRQRDVEGVARALNFGRPASPSRSPTQYMTNFLTAFVSWISPRPTTLRSSHTSWPRPWAFAAIPQT